MLTAFASYRLFWKTLVLGFLACPALLRGQHECGVLSITGTEDTINLTPYLTFWVDSSGHAPESVALSKNYIAAADTTYEWEPPSMFSDVAVWTRLKVRNTKESNVVLRITNDFYSPELAQIWIAYVSLDSTCRIRKDSLLSSDHWSSQGIWSERITFPASTLVEVRLRAYYSVFTPADISTKYYSLITPKTNLRYWLDFLNGNKYLIWFFTCAVSALFLISLFAFTQFITTREQAYLFYSLYVMIIFTYSWYWVGQYSFGDHRFFPTPFSNTRKIEVCCFYLGYFFYYHVIDYFSRGNSTRYTRYLRLMQIATPVLFAANATLFFVEKDYWWYLFYMVCRILYEVLNLVTIIWLFIFRKRITNFLGIGAAAMALGLSISFLSILSLIDLPNGWGIWSNNMTYFYTGALVEAVVFYMLFAYKHRLLILEYDLAQKDLIERLRREVAIQKELETERKSKEEANIQFLRAQMNPHFIFNSLTALRYLINSGKNAVAAKLTGDFAMLLRKVLQNSRKRLITLEEELNVLTEYLRIEEMIHPGKFRYVINIAEHIDLSEIDVPPTILQPFAENAIKHGLHPFDRTDPCFQVNIYQEHNILVIEMEDNGKGRLATKNSLYDSSGKESIGLEVTTQRIQQAYGENNPANGVWIEDLFDPAGHPAGTRVRIRIALPEE